MSPRKRLDLTGQHFCLLTAVEMCDELGPKGEVLWLCECRCGKTIKVRAEYLRAGTTRSCGCLLSGKYHRDTPYPANEDCALYRPENDDCRALEELMCATRGYCKFFKPGE